MKRQRRLPPRAPTRGKKTRHKEKLNKIGRKRGESLTKKPEVLQGVGKPWTMRLSKSKIGGFSSWCEYSWALDNIMGIKGSSAHYTTFGVDCHQIIEEYYLGMMKCKSEADILDYISDFDYEGHFGGKSCTNLSLSQRYCVQNLAQNGQRLVFHRICL